MMSPFVPFPIFCPYAQWRPSGLVQFPENNELLARLAGVDESCFPLISLWYCQRYLAWIAHSWPPEQANKAYYFETIHLERLLNWCFSEGLSLLSLRARDLHRYGEFFSSPSADWCAPTVSLKFLPNPLKPYESWMVNPAWRPFLSTPRDASCQFGMAQVVINRFIDFYRREVCKPGLSPVLRGFHKKKAVKNFHKLTEYEMDWYMASLGALSHGEMYKQSTLVYFALARWSRQSRRRLMGNSSNPGLLNQFYKGAHGAWVETLPGGGIRALNEQFTFIFESYLKHLELDPDQPLPLAKLFESSPEGKFARKCRDQLVQMAQGSDEPQIRIAAAKFQNLTFSSLRKSSTL